MSWLLQITQPYTSVESWMYDRFVAEAAVATTANLRTALRHEPRLDAPIIDVGCGGGQLALTLSAELPNSQIIGVDLSPDQVQRAKRRAAGNNRVHFEQGSAQDLPFDDETASAVISVGSIKHWPNPDDGLAEMIRVLRPGGLLIILELDRGCSLPDSRDFIARCRYPRILHWPAVAMLRTFAAGQSIDLDDARNPRPSAQ